MDKLKRHFTEVFDLPAELVMDLPLLMIVGNDKLYLENHKGISYYHMEEIKVKINNGFIVFTGEKLSINEINNESIIISGKVLSMIYEVRIGGIRND